MDYNFPQKLFPVYFNSGPPSSTFRHNVGGWGSYGQVLEVNVALHENDVSLPKVDWKFESQHQVKGETWVPVEPIAIPLLRPKRGHKWSSTALSDPLDFSEQMQNFYQYKYTDAFCTMSHILGDNFHFRQGRRKVTVLGDNFHFRQGRRKVTVLGDNFHFRQGRRKVTVLGDNFHFRQGRRKVTVLGDNFHFRQGRRKVTVLGDNFHFRQGRRKVTVLGDNFHFRQGRRKVTVLGDNFHFRQGRRKVTVLGDNFHFRQGRRKVTVLGDNFHFRQGRRKVTVLGDNFHFRQGRRKVTVLGDNFHFRQGRRKASERNAVHMWQMKHFMHTLKYKKCELTHLERQAKRYHNLLSDVIHDIPPALLADHLHEELTYQSGQEQFSDHATGGAIGYISFTNTSISQQGCLVYPGKAGLNKLNFHRVVLEFQEGKPPCFDVSHKPLSFQLNGTIRQITIGLPQDECHVGVRCDYLCGVWKVSEKNIPKTLEVIQTKQPATCLSASPHVLGELLVTSESGAAYLWTVGKGLQKFRQEYSNLYFNSKSSWRWCDFSGHPRVMVYADRTGVELTDIRTKDHCSHTLFRIGQTPDCKSGERVILSNYLRDVHTFHHLVTTQHSAYVMDERFPCLPMIQWDHMMEHPPMFAQVVAGLPSGGGTTKVLLGSQRSQEVILLQYSGGREEACVTRGPPRALLSPRDSLGHLPVQLPHRQHHAQDRLANPAAGLTVIHQSQAKEDCICVLQLTEAGDIFYHTLKSQTETFSKDDPPAPTQNSVGPEGRSGDVQSTLGTSRSSALGETWYSSGPQSPADDSGFEGRRQPWDTPRAGLEMVINDPHDDLYLTLATNTGLTDTQETAATAPLPTVQSLDTNVNINPVRPKAKVSDEALLVWRKWILKLLKCPRKRRNLPHKTTKTEYLLPDDSLQKDPLEDHCRRTLRKDLRETMRNGHVLVHRNTCLKPLALVPVPAPVEPSEWADVLSERMSASWEPGLGGWRSWWEERLGLNREEKVEALRRKRRRQKQAKAHSRIDLSGSFTSSISYQSDLDSASLSGWSSAASQYASSDVDSAAKSCYNTKWATLSEPGTPRATTPTPQTSNSQPTTPHRVFGSKPTTPLKQLSSFLSQPTIPYSQSSSSSLPTIPYSQSSSSSLPTIPYSQFTSSEPLFTPQKQPTVGKLLPWTTVGSDSSAAGILRTVVATQKPKPQNQDYLNSLFASQEPMDASQGVGFNESRHHTPLATSSQLSSISTSQRNLKVGLTSSEPKRKKSRMGF
ncbi:TATA box-binding protein-associated factor RNA polymerase I subunit C isoform X2 [Salvelinus namaycush]|uniref:TATA box-binding protein-associated factor RNA polymerase I subunit C isoform X2 n=1 Tax=Salvelinus namaycush TaxID=8040 RepID=A0A8U0QN04_SALNM|nr:TATA box-binding protein-associated factor RNA polymerase I subunit C isoform X2 [Salvelinus namaycush]